MDAASGVLGLKIVPREPSRSEPSVRDQIHVTEEFHIESECTQNAYRAFTGPLGDTPPTRNKTFTGLVEKYKQKYNQDLVGDGLGNFHVDFSMDGAVTVETPRGQTPRSPRPDVTSYMTISLSFQLTVVSTCFNYSV